MSALPAITVTARRADPLGQVRRAARRRTSAPKKPTTPWRPSRRAAARIGARLAGRLNQPLNVALTLEDLQDAYLERKAEEREQRVKARDRWAQEAALATASANSLQLAASAALAVATPSKFAVEAPAPISVKTLAPVNVTATRTSAATLAQLGRVVARGPMPELDPLRGPVRKVSTIGQPARSPLTSPKSRPLSFGRLELPWDQPEANPEPELDPCERRARAKRKKQRRKCPDRGYRLKCVKWEKIPCL